MIQPLDTIHLDNIRVFTVTTENTYLFCPKPVLCVFLSSSTTLGSFIIIFLFKPEKIQESKLM